MGNHNAGELQTPASSSSAKSIPVHDRNKAGAYYAEADNQGGEVCVRTSIAKAIVEQVYNRTHPHIKLD